VIGLVIRWFLKGLLLSLVFVALNQINAPLVFSETDSVPRITVQELKAKMDNRKNVVIIDVRTGQEYKSSKIKIKDAIRISIVQLEDRYKELPKDREIITYCT
jgi:predicted sulfurtransferase